MSPLGVERHEALSAPGRIRAFVAHGTAARRKVCSCASRGGITCRTRLAAAGQAGQAPINSQSCPSMSTGTLKSQSRMMPTLHVPMSEPSGELGRPGSRKWSRNDRVLFDDEGHEPHAKEEPDVDAPPTRRLHRRRVNSPMSSLKRNSRRTLSNTTRTCNKLPDVHMCTSEPALMDMDRGTLARIDRRLLAGLGDDEAYRTLRVPATAAKWSTWKRYCDSVGGLDGQSRHDAYRSRARQRVR